MNSKYPLLICFIVFIIICTSCVKTPEKPFVVSKNDGVFERRLTDRAADNYVFLAPNTVNESISYEAKGIEIVCNNVEVECAKNTNFSIYRGIPHSVTVDEIRKVLSTYFYGCETYEHTPLSIDNMTKAELEQKFLLPYKRAIFDIETGEIWQGNPPNNFEEGSLEELEKEMLNFYKTQTEIIEQRIKDAPDTRERKAWEITSYKPGNEVNIDIEMDNGKTGRLLVRNNGTEILVSFGDCIMEGESVLFRPSPYPPDLEQVDMTEDNELTRLIKRKSMTDKEIKTESEGLIGELGLSDYSFCEFAFGMCKNEDSIYEINKLDYEEFVNNRIDDYDLYYAASYTRQLDDMSVDSSQAWRYAYNSESCPFEYEGLTVWFTNSGISGFSLKGALTVDMIQKSVELMPFDELKSCIFNSIKNLSFYSEIKDGLVSIDVIKMTYIQVSEKNNASSFLYIPAWYIETSYQYSGTDYISGNNIYINAIDGSIIDLTQGY